MGKQIRIGDKTAYTVVGVAASVRSYGLKSGRRGSFTDSGEVFFSSAQPGNQRLVSPTLVIRTRVDPLSLADSVRQEVWKLDPNQPVTRVATLESIVSDFTAEPRFYMTLLSAFAAIALVLGMIGIYGVTSYWVAQRTHEIGVRLALGAQGSDVVRLITKQSSVLAVAGLTIGLAGSLALTRFLSGMIYAVKVEGELQTCTSARQYRGSCVTVGPLE